MASEIRVNSLTNRSGLSTVSITDTGAVIAGIVTATDAIFTGDITATNGTFSGNVSIGGTLTYEDVTNIDSVGIITAQAGVKVPDNQKIFLGTGDDLEIYHDGNNRIRNSSNLIIEKTDGEDMASFVVDGAVNLFHNGTKKFETTSTGVKVTGDSVFGANSKAKLFENGTQSGVQATNSGSSAHLMTHDGNEDIHVDPSGYIKFEVAGSERIRINSDGRLAIGNATNNASPTAKFQVKADDGEAADLYIGQFDNLEATAGQSYGVAIRAGSNSTDHGFRVKNRANDTTQFLVRGDGKIGIGTAVPTHPLHINATGTSYIKFSDEASGAGATDGAIFGLDNPHLYAWNYQAGDFVVATNATERLRIRSSGIPQFTTTGTHYPSASAPAFVVNSNGDHALVLNNQNTTDPRGLFIYQNQDVNNGTSYFWRARAGGTDRAHLYSNGNLNISGGMQAASVNLQSSSTSSWFQTGTSIASYPYVWAAKNSSSNTWHSGLQTDGDLYLGGNLAGTNNIGLIGSTGSGWFSGGLGIGGFAAANTIEEYEEGTWTPVINKSGVSGTAGTPTSYSGYYRRIGGLMFVSFYWYKNSGTFGNNAGEWYVSGLPYNLRTLANSAYQFIPGGYSSINGVSYNGNGGTAQDNRWQSNSTNGAATLALYGTTQTTNWTSGYLEFSASGVLMLA